ncbi:hypothetical protein BMS3Abin11_02152 [bacterium BMS3Abin11]|nr:hypothetical protein BMS3Abin11_02152 [bacterium BMS3Abin11]GMT40520.1 MAG: hypothetical protein IEMM0001_1255 [bacterium]
MGNSLFDQLNKSGLVDKNKAKQAKKEKHRQAKKHKGRQTKPLDKSKLRAQQVQTEKAQRDRELNQQRKQAAEKKAIAAQIKQLIEMNRIEADETESNAEIAFNFVDGKNVQRFYVTEKLQEQLIRGHLVIVKLESSYNLVPAGIAEKIILRDPSCVMHCAATEPVESDVDDPYADYQVPDDLMW